MDVYEKMIANSINKIANKDIYFNSDEIMKSSDEIVSKIVGEFVSWACTPTHITPISIARNCLKQFPAEWVSQMIGIIGDCWNYLKLFHSIFLIGQLN